MHGILWILTRNELTGGVVYRVVVHHKNVQQRCRRRSLAAKALQHTINTEKPGMATNIHYMKQLI